MTVPQFIVGLKGYARAHTGKSADDEENEITEEQFLAVLAKHAVEGRT